MAEKEKEHLENREKKLYVREARFISSQVIGKNRIEWIGLENRITNGPNIIVGNHPGFQEDIASIICSYPERILKFTANKEIFNKDELNTLIQETVEYSAKKTARKLLGKKHYETADLIGQIGTDFFNFISAPLRNLVAKYISSGIQAVGAIPVNVLGTNNTDWLGVAESYLLKGDAVVFLQYNKDKKDKNTKERKHILSKYAPSDVKAIDEFKYGAFKLAYNMFEKYGMDVPVTPLSLKGTAFFSLPFSKIRIHFGEPQYASKYALDENPVSALKESLERKVVDLYMASK
jgi:1-acyl-sn-glycerol-3-phosphate acyltransferase